MLNINIFCGFKLKNKVLKSYETDLTKRFKGDFNLTITELPYNNKQAAELIKKQHSEILKEKLGHKSLKFLCAEQGNNLNSIEFSKLIFPDLILHNTIEFIIGGPYGLDPKAFDNIDHTIALSKLTFTAEISRIVLLEQLFRAIQIKQGKPYHKD